VVDVLLDPAQCGDLVVEAQVELHAWNPAEEPQRTWSERFFLISMYEEIGQQT
jgi:hypothetical protein